MPLLDDTGQPLFPDPAGAAPSPSVVTAAPPPAAEPVPHAGPLAEPAAAAPTMDLSVTPEPPAQLPPAPIDWDAPDNPYRVEAERARYEAQRAQATASQMQQHALAEAERASQTRQATLLHQQAALNARVGEYTPEEFQRHAAAITRALAVEFQQANRDNAAIKQHFSGVTNQMVWEQDFARAVNAYGLTRDEIARIQVDARDSDHLFHLASQAKRGREERVTAETRTRDLTEQISQLRTQIQQGRSDQAAARREDGVDRAGGVGGSPIPAPSPTSPLGLLRLAITGNPNTPIRP